MSGRLFVVGTPIGNLGDFSPRGVEALERADFIAAEDTRVTVKLLNHFDIKKEMLSYYEHNKNDRGNLIIERLLKGESCALVSDAGMPAISDPGEDLVRTAREMGIEVEAVPGPSALITALSISGMPSGRFCFEGFLSMNKISRRRHLEEVKNEKRTLIFYEAPHKLPATLKDMLASFGNREIAIVRELTKIHETVFKTTLAEAAEYYTENTPRGEFVLIIRGATEEKRDYTLEDALEITQRLISEGQSTSSAAKEAAEITGIKKGDIYRAIIN
ncbi:MAG: 16S rRNA (cytidine(1402)-2'-O)-methyltransferase [Clostridia bacterium]|nr:16S rRNA (cytidine(1402)-2'-O)-methyltransferase [Clostridia bacterium]